MLTLDRAHAWYPGSDAVHGFDHIVRVYRLAERLAQAEGADLEIVRAAALLHDIQDLRASQDGQARQNHHLTSAELARHILVAEGWNDERIAAVQHCIRTHRFRDEREPPRTLEAQVLFDADKLDAIGAIGAARAIAFAAQAGNPIYAPPSQQFLETGVLAPGEVHSAYHEHVFKLQKIRQRMFTRAGRLLAKQRHRAMSAFFDRLGAEIQGLK